MAQGQRGRSHGMGKGNAGAHAARLAGDALNEAGAGDNDSEGDKMIKLIGLLVWEVFQLVVFVWFTWRLIVACMAYDALGNEVNGQHVIIWLLLLIYFQVSTGRLEYRRMLRGAK
jgi:hypothetical protein